MRFIDDETLPLESAQEMCIITRSIVAHDDHIELRYHRRRHRHPFLPPTAAWLVLVLHLEVELPLPDESPRSLTASIDNRIELIPPLLKLFEPVIESRSRRDYEERSINELLIEEIVEERHCLNRLTEAHFIRQDHALLLIVPLTQPIHSVYLELVETSTCHVTRLVLRKLRHGRRREYDLTLHFPLVLVERRA